MEGVDEMKRQNLVLEGMRSLQKGAAQYRTLIKTAHGRKIYLELSIYDKICHINNCFYYDRNTGRKNFPARPLKLRTRCFPYTKKALLSVVEKELDRKFYGVELVKSPATFDLNEEAYITFHNPKATAPYRFLIFVGGGGELSFGLPALLQTRLKNKLHRAIYVELAYYNNGQGVVQDCHYYDRRYKTNGKKVAPPSLVSCFFPYTRSGILKLVNNELECDFTHLLIAPEHEVDIFQNVQPLCGNL